MTAMGRSTLKDVARHAGVSVTTASVALNGVRDGVRVSDETRRRVLEAAASLDYRPNTVARSLRTQQSRTIGFLSDEVTTTPFAVAMLAAAQDEAARRGYLLFVVNLGARASAALRARGLELLAERHPDGVVYAAMYHQVVPEPPHLPPRTVFLNCRPKEQRHRCIIPDDEDGAYRATRELVEAGHRRIAYVDSNLRPVASVLRLAGYRRALAEEGVAAPKDLHVRVPPSSQGGRVAVALMDLPAHRRPTGIFCFNDRVAMGLLPALRHRGLRVPADVSVVGFDDQEFIAAELDPPLTTVRLPHAAMGRRAIEMLLDQEPPTRQQRGEGLTVLEECVLVRRDSVGPPP